MTINKVDEDFVLSVKHGNHIGFVSGPMSVKGMHRFHSKFTEG